MNLKFKPNLSRVSVVGFIGYSIFSLIIFSLAYFISYIFLLIFFLILTPSYIITVGRTKNTRYLINDDFISKKIKFISEFEEDVPVKQVTNIDFHIGWFWDKIFGTGLIKIYTSGSNMPDLVIQDINSVHDIYNEINNLLKLNKSVTIKDSGDYVSANAAVESKLLERIKPSAGIATLSTVLSSILGLLFVSYYIMMGIFEIGLADNIAFLIVLGGLVYISLLVIIGSFTHTAYKKKYYDFYNDKLEYYDGFFSLNKSTIPMERITNLDENRSIFDRIFGTSSIGVETAGSSGAEIKIRFVKDGERLVSNLKEVLKQHGRN